MTLGTRRSSRTNAGVRTSSVFDPAKPPKVSQMEGFCVWRSPDTDDGIVEEERTEFNFSGNWNDVEESQAHDVVEASQTYDAVEDSQAGVIVEESPLVLSGNPACSICVNRICNVFLHPCDHQLCARCASRLEHCPFCRSHIANVVEDLTMY